MMKEETEQSDERDVQVHAKKSYLSPRLIVHGDIEVITQGDEGGEQDGELAGGTSVGGGTG